MELFDQLRRWWSERPDRTAHHGLTGPGQDQPRSVAYGELLDRAERLARHLRSTLPTGDRTPVLVHGHKEPDMLVGFLGVVGSGRPYVPVDASLPSRRVDEVAAAAGARLRLTPAQIEAICAQSPGGSGEPTFLRRPPGPDDPFYLIFTSGSTGQPKGVLITAGNLTSFLRGLGGQHAWAPDGEVFLNQAPFSFDLSVMDLYLSWSTGGTLFSVSQSQVAGFKPLFEALTGSGVTTWVSTPSFAQLCLAEPTFRAARLPRLRRWLFCGEVLRPAVAAQLIERFPAAELWNTYGPTEATVATTSVRITPERLAADGPLPVGWALPGTRVEVLGPGDLPCPPEVSGEIVVVGPNVSPGYAGRPDLTAQAFLVREGRPAYRTGDRGRLDADGLLWFEGRGEDGQIKLHGYRIELADVEANLTALPGVREAVVLPVVRAGAVESLTAFVTLARPGADPGPAGDAGAERSSAATGSPAAAAANLRAALGERLPAYMVPRRLRVIDAMPLTANGKLDRRRLAAEGAAS